MPDRLGKEQKRWLRISVLAILVATLVVGAVVWLAVQKVNNRTDNVEHGSISIIGNEGFTTANGVVGGSGTESDPYIIADWSINASTGSGISVSGTDAYFVIRNCTINATYTFQNGIVLLDCVNGILMNNNCSNANYGIWLVSSSDNKLINNICSSNHLNGIKLASSSNNTLVSNNCSASGEDGVNLYSMCNNNTLINNTCNSNGKDGLYLYLSRNNTLINNTCSSNHDAGIGLYSSSSNTLVNNDCLNNTRGIYIYFSSSDNTLSKNNCSANRFGIYGEYSGDNNEISWNQICSNSGYGAMIYGLNNRIWSNTYIDNNGATHTYNASRTQAYDNNADNWWNSTDGYGNYWSDWTTPDIESPSGVVDLPYNIAGFDPGAKDYYPLTTP